MPPNTDDFGSRLAILPVVGFDRALIFSRTSGFDLSVMGKNDERRRQSGQA